MSKREAAAPDDNVSSTERLGKPIGEDPLGRLSQVISPDIPPARIVVRF